jgi:2-phosphosulfolactate phosphatase
MTRALRVHMLPQLVEPADLRGRTVVVIDVLRATTTIAYALANGATSVVPCLEIDEARATARQLGSGVVLGGERRGLRIEGFDLGNSPSEYTRAAVEERTVVFTTTNGTRAMRHAAAADAILIGSFANLSAVVAALANCERADLLCAGTNGAVTAEDTLFAGAVAHRLGSDEWGMENDQAFLARDAWRAFLADGGPLSATLRACQGGKNLIAEGFDADIDTAAQIDALSLVPRLNVGTGRIAVR